MKHYRYEEACRRDQPLQAVLHAELGQPVARMQDEGDDGRTDAIEDAAHAFQVAEMHEERAERRHDQKIRQDECPTASPGPPKAAAQISDEDSDLNGERPGQRLADRDRLAHLLAGQPLALANKLALHLADKRHWPAEAHEAEAQEIKGQVSDRDPTRLCAHPVVHVLSLALSELRVLQHRPAPPIPV